MKLDLPRERQFEAGVWYSTPASTWYPTHYHEEFELKLVLWGRASYQMDSTRIELGPGSLLWLAPGQEHTLLGISDQLSMWVASFRLDRKPRPAPSAKSQRCFAWCVALQLDPASYNLQG